MQSIPNVATQDKYVAALELGPDPVATQLIYVVANAAVLAQFAPQRSDGTVQPYGQEELITPSTNTVQRVAGVRFRSAVAGVPARVVAQLVGPDDPQFGGGVPFTATLAATGGLTPGVAAVQVEKDGVLIGQEAAINFAGLGGGTWTIADNGALGRIDINPFAGAAVFAGDVFANYPAATGMRMASNQTLYYDNTGNHYLYLSDATAPGTLTTAGILNAGSRIISAGMDVQRVARGTLGHMESGVITVAPGAPGATVSFTLAFVSAPNAVCASNNNTVPVAIFSTTASTISLYHASGASVGGYWIADGV